MCYPTFKMGNVKCRTLYNTNVHVKFRIYGETLQSNGRYVQSAFME